MFNYEYRGYEYNLFFVLKGLVNGEGALLAQSSGTGEPLKDGWYYITGDDVDGVGPYDFKEEAIQHAQMALNAEDESRMLVQMVEFVSRLRNNGFDVATITDAFNRAIVEVG